MHMQETQFVKTIVLRIQKPKNILRRQLFFNKISLKRMTF